MAGVMRTAFVVDDATNASEALDQVVVGLPLLQIAQQGRGAAAQLLREVRFERPEVALRGMKEDACRLRVAIRRRRAIAMMNAVVPRLATHRVGRFDSQ